MINTVIPPSTSRSDVTRVVRRLPVVQTPALSLTWVAEKSRDRFGQYLEVEQLGIARRLFSSIEGDDQTCWPTSPPIQDLSAETSDVGPFLAGVGMAGDSHWSLSISLVSLAVAREAFLSCGHDSAVAIATLAEPCIYGLEFDVACRIRQSPEWLGASYESTTADRRFDSKTISGPRNADLASSPSSPSIGGTDDELGMSWVWQVLTVDRQPQLQLSHRENQLVFDAATEGLQPPMTVRWKYCLLLSLRAVGTEQL